MPWTGKSKALQLARRCQHIVSKNGTTRRASAGATNKSIGNSAPRVRLVRQALTRRRQRRQGMEGTGVFTLAVIEHQREGSPRLVTLASCPTGTDPWGRKGSDIGVFHRREPRFKP